MINNTRELLDALRREGVDPRSYHVDCQERQLRLDEGGLLIDRLADGSWAVGPVERGDFAPSRIFDREAEACAYAYEILTRQPGQPPRTVSNDELAESRRLIDETWKLINERQRDHGSE